MPIFAPASGEGIPFGASNFPQTVSEIDRSCLICLVARGFDENGENGFVPKAGHEKSSYLMVLL